MEHNYTIPVNEAFEKSIENPSCGCPLCALYKKLEEDELDLILGASMMEPAIRIQTNQEGFCRDHYDRMFVRKNRLGMALTLESHLAELRQQITNPPLVPVGSKPQKRIADLKKSCYVCRRIGTNFDHMTDTVVYLWEKDEAFRQKYASQPYFCLPHYEMLLSYGQKRLDRGNRADFAKMTAKVVETYFDTLQEDVSWFCKKFDYRFADEPWKNSKDAVERAIKFLRSDLHN